MSAAGIKHLGLIAGDRGLPLLIARWAKARRVPISIVGVRGCADKRLRKCVASAGYLDVCISEITRAARWLKSRGADTVIMVGGVSGARVRPTFDLLRIAFRLVFMRRRYDGVLRLVIERLERVGLRVAGIAEIMPELVVGKGVQGAVMPSARDMAEVRKCWPKAEAFARTDKGQSVIAFGGELLAVEDFSGTDALILRAAKLKKGRPGGVLLKLLKPGQDTRVDVPVIGENTVLNLEKGGFSGVAVEAGRVIIEGDRRKVVGLADRHGIFILGR